MRKRPLPAAITFRNIPAHEKFNFIFKLFNNFNLKILKGKIPIFTFSLVLQIIFWGKQSPFVRNPLFQFLFPLLHIVYFLG